MLVLRRGERSLHQIMGSERIAGYDSGVVGRLFRRAQRRATPPQAAEA